jgi:hypothetical protein
MIRKFLLKLYKEAKEPFHRNSLFGTTCKTKVQIVVVRKPRVILTSTSMDNLPAKIKELLDNFVDIMVDELPHSLLPIRSSSHHIDLFPRESLPNRASYRLTPQEN